MRKLRLDVEELEVESFHTHAGARRPGTVNAHGTGFDEEAAGAEAEAIAVPAPITPFCPSVYTCTCPIVTYCASCVNTCDACTVRTCASGGDICCA